MHEKIWKRGHERNQVTSRRKEKGACLVVREKMVMVEGGESFACLGCKSFPVDVIFSVPHLQPTFFFLSPSTKDFQRLRLFCLSWQILWLHAQFVYVHSNISEKMGPSSWLSFYGQLHGNEEWWFVKLKGKRDKYYSMRVYVYVARIIGYIT